MAAAGPKRRSMEPQEMQKMLSKDTLLAALIDSNELFTHLSVRLITILQHCAKFKWVPNDLESNKTQNVASTLLNFTSNISRHCRC